MTHFEIKIHYTVADASAFAAFVNSIIDPDFHYSATVGNYKSCYVNGENCLPGTRAHQLLTALQREFFGAKS